MTPAEILRKIPVGDVEIWIVKPPTPIPQQQRPIPDAEQMMAISQLTAAKFGIHPELLFNKARGKQEVSDCRMLCMYLIKQFVPYSSLKTIGNFFSRDHTTVIYAHKVIVNRIAVNDPCITPILKEAIKHFKNDKV